MNGNEKPHKLKTAAASSSPASPPPRHVPQAWGCQMKAIAVPHTYHSTIACCQRYGFVKPGSRCSLAATASCSLHSPNTPGNTKLWGELIKDVLNRDNPSGFMETCERWREPRGVALPSSIRLSFKGFLKYMTRYNTTTSETSAQPTM